MAKEWIVTQFALGILMETGPIAVGQPELIRAGDRIGSGTLRSQSAVGMVHHSQFTPGRLFVNYIPLSLK